jgi:hypothetical protein
MDPSPDRVQMLSMSSRPSVIGRVRTCANVTLLEWIFITLSVITIGTGFGFTIYRMCTLSGDSSELVFSILILANLCFSTFYLFHGIFQEQPFEILLLLLTTILLWILIMINYISSLSVSDKLKLIRFLISSCLTVPMIIFGCVVGRRYWTSARLIFRTVGGDWRLQLMCKQLFFTYSLLMFDGQAMISAVILIMRRGVLGITNEQIFILVIGTIFTCLWLLLGYTAMRRESMNITWLFGICSIAQPLYVLYIFVQAVDILINSSTLLMVCIFIASGTLLITHFSLLAMVPVVSFNYGKGLKEKIYGAPPIAQNPAVVPINQERNDGSEGSGGQTSSRDSNTNTNTPSSSASITQPLLRSGTQPQNYESIVQVHNS